MENNNVEMFESFLGVENVQLLFVLIVPFFKKFFFNQSTKNIPFLM